MADGLQQFIEMRDQLCNSGRLLTLPGVTSGNRKRAVLAYRQMAETLADALVRLAQRHLALARENEVLRARMADQGEQEPGEPLL